MAEIDKVEVTIELSSWCPISCIHCSTWNSKLYENHLKKDEILPNVENVENALNYMASRPDIYFIVRFSGGEPMPFIDENLINTFKEKCPSIHEWIITTSGAVPIHKYNPYIFKEAVYRVSLYGNVIQHSKITRNRTAYYNTLYTIASLIDAGAKVELTTPIFGLSNSINVAVYGNLFKVPIRVAKLIGTKECKAKPRIIQLAIAKIMKLIHKDVHLTCSLYGCNDKCDYRKISFLANGRIIGCAKFKLDEE